MMKTIGLIGGMSWESTAEYYRIINDLVKQRLGGFHSAELVLYSVDFAEIERMQHAGEWESATQILIDAAQKIEKAGADCILLCTNTMHKLFAAVQKETRVPLLHIGDASGEEIRKQGLKTVGLLGTKFTMEQGFYKERLRKKYGLKILVPRPEERQAIHKILYTELCLGDIKETSRRVFKKIIDRLLARGAQGIILGCTEIPLIVEKADYRVPIFDTTELHARAAVDFALGE